MSCDQDFMSKIWLELLYLLTSMAREKDYSSAQFPIIWPLIPCWDVIILQLLVESRIRQS